VLRILRPNTVEVVNGPVKRVVSLVPSITEDLYAVGAGDKVVGVSAYTDYPPQGEGAARDRDVRFDLDRADRPRCIPTSRWYRLARALGR